MMEFFIQAASAISPQKTFGREPFPAERVEHAGNRMTVLEPDYATLIDPKSIRRMSRIIRMGVGAAVACLRDADVRCPDAIVTGTAYGCLADTGVFLSKMIEQEEEMLPPTAFIQSTHNTVGGQIALLLQCHGYNNTFVHRGLSFESALLDGMLLLREGEAEYRGGAESGIAAAAIASGNRAGNVLVGAVEEITDYSHAILSRFGLYRRPPVSNFDLLTSEGRGTIAGEGAAFFLLTGQPSSEAWAKLEGLDSFYKPKDGDEIEDRIRGFLSSRSIGPEDVDLVIAGNNGDQRGDRIYRQLAGSVFNGTAMIAYKDLCGEYPTASSFALWLAVQIVRTGKLPAAIRSEGVKKAGMASEKGGIKRILIYNHYLGLHHSLMLVSGC